VWLLVVQTTSVDGAAPVTNTIVLGVRLAWTEGGWRMTGADPGPGPVVGDPGTAPSLCMGWRDIVEPVG